jgi:hypothetical protein
MCYPTPEQAARKSLAEWMARLALGALTLAALCAVCNGCRSVSDGSTRGYGFLTDVRAASVTVKTAKGSEVRVVVYSSDVSEEAVRGIAQGVAQALIALP